MYLLRTKDSEEPPPFLSHIHHTHEKLTGHFIVVRKDLLLLSPLQMSMEVEVKNLVILSEIYVVKRRER